MKKLLLFSMMLFSSALILAQNQYDSRAELNKMITTPNSPEAQAFSAYGDTPVDLRIGKPNISIPLYSHKGLESGVSVSLTYDMDNRKVEDIASGVGLGWNLAVGGRVTRNVNGFADRFIGVPTGNNSFATMATSPTLRSKYLQFRDKDISSGQDIFTNEAEADAYIDFLDKVHSNTYDIAMDAFSVNAPGLSDMIVMTVDETDSNAPLIPVALNNPNLDIKQFEQGLWQIVNEGGTEYWFDEMEVTESFSGLDISDPFSPPIGPIALKYNSSWVLTKMISPNKKDIYEFEYFTHNPWSNPVNSWISQRTDANLLENGGGNNWTSSESNNATTYNITQKRLDRVLHNGVVIIEIGHGSREDFELDNKVASVTIKSPIDQSTVQRFDFVFDYFGNDTNTGNEEEELRLRLDEIEISGKGYGTNGYSAEKKYQFVYEFPDDFPKITSFGQDEFGFYNGADGNQQLYPHDTFGTTISGGGNRAFHLSSAKIGILNKIIYPTGGFTEYTYESHLQENITPNGLRIASITSFTDENEEATQKIFEYGPVQTEDRNKPLLEYYVDRAYINNNTIYTDGATWFRMSKSPMGNQPYITYEEVIEKRVDPTNGTIDNGYTKHTFYNKNVSQHPSGNVTLNFPPFSSEYSSTLFNGQIKQQEVFDTDDTPLSKSESILDTGSFYDQTNLQAFTTVDAPERAYDYIVKSPHGSGTQVKLYYEPGIVGSVGVSPPNACNSNGNLGCYQYLRYARIQPKRLYNKKRNQITAKQVSSSHLNGNTITQTSTSTFDSTIGYQLRESVTTTSESDETLVTNYTYPKDLAATVPIMQDLVDANRVSTPVKVEQFLRIDDGNSTNDVLQSTQQTEFITVTNGNNEDLILPDRIQVARRGDIPETRLIFEKYDDQGNLVQATKPGSGTAGVYIWGFNGRVPMAKIDNADYDALKSQTTTVDDVEDAANLAAMNTALNSLRSFLANTDAMLTTYHYNEQLQVERIIDPRGYTSNFHYDLENRLEYVTDQDGSVLSKSEYNYKLNN